MELQSNSENRPAFKKQGEQEGKQKLKLRAAIPNVDPIYDIQGLSEYLGITRSWLYKNYKKLPHFRLGSLIKFRKLDIDRHIQTLKKEQM